MIDNERQEQQQERIRTHLEEVRSRMEQAIHSNNELEWKRIQVDAAMTAVLAIVAELLPVTIQEQVRMLLSLHEKAWNIDMPSTEGETPHTPVSEALMDAIPHKDEDSQIES